MAYIKKNVNVILLLIVLVTLVALAGLSTFFQSTYRNLSLEYRQKIGEINLLSFNLTQKEQTLHTTLVELEEQDKAEEQLGRLYTNLSDVKKRLEGDLDSTRNELVNTFAELKDTQLKLDEKKEELVSEKGRVKALQDEVTSLNSKISSKNSEICALKQRLNESC